MTTVLALTQLVPAPLYIDPTSYRHCFLSPERSAFQGQAVTLVGFDRDQYVSCNSSVTDGGRDSGLVSALGLRRDLGVCTHNSLVGEGG